MYEKYQKELNFLVLRYFYLIYADDRIFDFLTLTTVSAKLLFITSAKRLKFAQNGEQDETVK